MTLRRRKALPVTRRALRAALWVVVAALSISQSAHAQEHCAARTEVGAIGWVAPPPAGVLPHSQSPGSFFLSRRFLIPTYITLQALDYSETQYGFTHEDWHEKNPLVPHSSAGRAVYFGLTAAGVIGGSAYLEHKGHRAWARALLVGGIAVEGYAAVSSLRGLQR
jgi:hypothetical protein